MFRRLLILAFSALYIGAGAHAAETYSEVLLDAQGYPIDDLRYEKIRRWHEMEERGLQLFRAEDYERAYAALAEPAQHGFKRAQHSIALMHINGQSVEKNVLVGVALLGLAAETGDRKLEKEYKAAVKALPERFRKPVREQTAYYIARYGMQAQGISCGNVTLPGSHRKAMRCLKQLGEYKAYPWEP